ncbi:hypothetical protein RFI_18522 [Reticulomyxa filosa]|uniref:Uncharacterized protein n=1 Tax=Reticulomyxa filosa TaxID=46433 RepID=X6MZ15_RETFI|nr:hypothetical protein RFI_18522 [Reticulomyxa filosa]|eukprot:ETO18734.1 hypothetical protein RFI_18522 [Reticulomyxa filosa]
MFVLENKNQEEEEEEKKQKNDGMALFRKQKEEEGWAFNKKKKLFVCVLYNLKSIRVIRNAIHTNVQKKKKKKIGLVGCDLFDSYGFITTTNIKNHWESVVVPGALLVLFAFVCIFYRDGSDKPLLANQEALFQAYLDNTYGFTHGGHEASILDSKGNTCLKWCKLVVLNCPQDHFCLGVCCYIPGAHLASRVCFHFYLFIISIIIIIITG